MIETTLRDYLVSKLTVPVVLEQPENVPTSFVLIEKTGGSEEEHIKTATVAIQSYDISLYAAATLNEAVKAAMESIADYEADVVRCSLNSDYNYTDATTKSYRYQAVFNITHY